MKQLARSTRPKPPSLAELQARVQIFNQQFPIGTPVILTKDDGSRIETTTRSTAAVLGGHSPVVWLDGYEAAWHIDRVTKVAKGAA